MKNVTCFNIKVTKNQNFTLFLGNTVLEKPQGGGQIDTPAFAGLTDGHHNQKESSGSVLLNRRS